MAKRLTEADIRRIFREEAELEKGRQAQLAQLDNLPPDIRKTWERLKGTDIKFKPGTKGVRGVRSAVDVDWVAHTREIIDTYWEVVEEECNE